MKIMLESMCTYTSVVCDHVWIRMGIGKLADVTELNSEVKLNNILLQEVSLIVSHIFVTISILANQ